MCRDTQSLFNNELLCTDKLKPSAFTILAHICVFILCSLITIKGGQGWVGITKKLIL